MADFKPAYLIGRDNEGGYANDPADKGGETYAGVARNFWPKWEGWKIIDIVKKNKALKRGDKIDNAELEGHVANFYRANFWDKIQGDLITDQQIANLFYDWSLTSGGARAKVQDVIGTETDGKFGTNSVQKLNERIGTLGGQQVFESIKAARIHYYHSIATGSNAKFLDGWLNRVNRFNYTHS